MRETESMNEAQRREYLKKLKDFKKRGVKVLIDGIERPENQWNELFGVRDDGGFYMGDYIMGEEEMRRKKEILKEIRFDRVYI